MKKIAGILPVLLLICGNVRAGYDDNSFKNEVRDGVDISVGKITYDSKTDIASGELGQEVYETKTNKDLNDLGVFIPTDMYLRAGYGINLAFASSKVDTAIGGLKLADTFNTQIGLGWDLSSYVRTEVDFQSQTFGVEGYPDAQASARGIGGNLYFDFARRYIRTGDITRRRTVVPFMGIGTAVGTYKFEGLNGADGSFIAPRAVFGINFMLNDLIGVDLSYQYQLFINNGFGWATDGSDTNGVSDVIASFRFNF